MFATHFAGLGAALAAQGVVQVAHMAHARTPDGSFRALHRIMPGPPPGGSCGVLVAQLAGLPPAVLARAHAVSSRLQRRRQRGEQQACVRRGQCAVGLLAALVADGGHHGMGHPCASLVDCLRELLSE